MIYVLSGPVHSGKTTFLKSIIDELKSTGIPVCGYLSLSLWEDQSLTGYDLFNIESSEIHPFIRCNGRPEWERIGPFFFIPETLVLAKEVILKASNKGGLCMVDEIGPLELSGKGVWPAVEKALACTSSHMDFLFVIREGLVDAFQEIPGFKPEKIFLLEEASFLLPKLLS